MLRMLTGGESHGEALIGILEGMPSGLAIDKAFIDAELSRRQQGYGRGERMKIEKDQAKILSGLKKGITIGSPISILIENEDFSIDKLPAVENPRPGHADLSGILKYGFSEVRPVLERASARETAMRVALGAVCKIFLKEFGIRVISHVIAIGGVKARSIGLGFDDILNNVKGSKLNCADNSAEKLMTKEIDNAKANGDTLGGVFEIIIEKVPVGLGTYVQADRRLDGRLAGIVMSIPGIKAVEIGNGVDSSGKLGSKVHDELFYSKEKLFYRRTNNAGGIEGGVSNGEDIIVCGYMKPISTLMKGLSTVNINTKKESTAATERADVCAVPSAGVIGEAVCSFIISDAFLEKFGCDSIKEIKRSYTSYVGDLKV